MPAEEGASVPHNNETGITIGVATAKVTRIPHVHPKTVRRRYSALVEPVWASFENDYGPEGGGRHKRRGTPRK